MTFTTHTSFSELVDKYDGFILDQFGVMHNGKEGLPGATECVQKLSSLGKKLIILSNTSSTSEAALNKLPKLGFDKSCISGAVTSGEEASLHISKEYGSSETKKKAIWFTWADDTVPLKFLSKCGNIEPTTNIDEADFVISHGTEVVRSQSNDPSDHLSLGSFMNDGDLTKVIDPILKKCIERNLPMVCANPDFIMKRSDGTTGHMPGKIAQKYEEMGGQCSYFGKPHVEHFKACLRELGLDASRVAHVGDSLHHDIAGANASGIPCVFITGGIHSTFFSSPVGEIPNDESLQKLFEEEGQTPTHVAPLFKF
jgi:HAD superfamily hydrolase (TIGR01459 family)